MPASVARAPRHAPHHAHARAVASCGSRSEGSREGGGAGEAGARSRTGARRRPPPRLRWAGAGAALRVAWPSSTATSLCCIAYVVSRMLYRARETKQACRVVAHAQQTLKLFRDAKCARVEVQRGTAFLFIHSVDPRVRPARFGLMHTRLMHEFNASGGSPRAAAHASPLPHCPIPRVPGQRWSASAAVPRLAAARLHHPPRA